MSTDPAHDANSHFDKVMQANETFSLAQKQVGQEIMEMFTKAVRKVSPKNLYVPYTDYAFLGRGGCVKYQPLRDVVADVCSFGAPLDALMTVMAVSNCPLVDAWRVAMAEDYIKHHAADIAQVEVEV